jgi:hypothetical protein
MENDLDIPSFEDLDQSFETAVEYVLDHENDYETDLLSVF